MRADAMSASGHRIDTLDLLCDEPHRANELPGLAQRRAETTGERLYDRVLPFTLE